MLGIPLQLKQFSWKMGKREDFFLTPFLSRLSLGLLKIELHTRISLSTHLSVCTRRYLYTHTREDFITLSWTWSKPALFISQPSTQVNFSEGGPGSNSTGSEVASMSSQLPDTPNSMVASPIEAWGTFTQMYCFPSPLETVGNYNAELRNKSI